MSSNEEPEKTGRRASETFRATLPQPDSERPLATPLRSLSTCPKPKASGEGMDGYAGVLFAIPNTRYRVAVCTQGYQYILQYRQGQDAWMGRKYFSRKERLADTIKELFGADAYMSVEAHISQLRI